MLQYCNIFIIQVLSLVGFFLVMIFDHSKVEGIPEAEEALQHVICRIPSGGNISDNSERFCGLLIV